MENLNLPIRLTVTEAEKMFGVSSNTIRKALKNNELHYVVTRGRYRINFDSLLEWSQNSARRRTNLSTAGIGRYVGQWKINNTKFSPNEKLISAGDNSLEPNNTNYRLNPDHRRLDNQNQPS